jgi:hypothetical protein
LTLTLNCIEKTYKALLLLPYLIHSKKAENVLDLDAQYTTIDARTLEKNFTIFSNLGTIVCLNFKFPPRVELYWQNKNISKLGIVITEVGNINVIRKQRNLLDTKMKNALVKCRRDKKVSTFFSFILKS